MIVYIAVYPKGFGPGLNSNERDYETLGQANGCSVFFDVRYPHSLPLKLSNHLPK
jgi:hypothetical protein